MIAERATDIHLPLAQRIARCLLQRLVGRTLNRLCTSPMHTNPLYGDCSRLSSLEASLHHSPVGPPASHRHLLLPCLTPTNLVSAHQSSPLSTSRHTSGLLHTTPPCPTLHATRPMSTSGGPIPPRRATVAVHTNHWPHTGPLSGWKSP
jgi:hypothetical protein